MPRGIHGGFHLGRGGPFAALEAGRLPANEKIDKLAQTKQEDPRGRRQEEFCGRIFKIRFCEPLTEENFREIVSSVPADGIPLHTSVEKIVLSALEISTFLYPEWQALAKKEKDSQVVAANSAGLYFWDSIPDKAPAS